MSDRRKHIFVLVNSRVNEIVNVCIIVPALCKEMIVVDPRCVNCYVIFPCLSVSGRLVARLSDFDGPRLFADRKLLNYFQV